MGKLFLLPNLLGDSDVSGVIPRDVQEVIKNTRVFVTEEVKNTRRYLKKIDKSNDIDDLTFLELNEHTDRRQIASYLSYLETQNVGIISEAGCPGIADPGAELVALAHEHGYTVVPLVGPSSILLALIASGCDGQRFSFNGYLPVARAERVRALKVYEKESAAERRTQVFIETPYRNTALLEDMLAALSPSTLLSIACDLSTPGEYIRTLPVGEWKGEKKPDLHKRPTIFTFHAGC
jgi:16S rRNA (cytidine1402-2'-O)-methyltransferase